MRTACLETRPPSLPSPATPCNQQVGRIFNSELEEQMALEEDGEQEAGTKADSSGAYTSRLVRNSRCSPGNRYSHKQ